MEVSVIVACRHSSRMALIMWMGCVLRRTVRGWRMATGTQACTEGLPGSLQSVWWLKAGRVLRAFRVSAWSVRSVCKVRLSDRSVRPFGLSGEAASRLCQRNEGGGASPRRPCRPRCATGRFEPPAYREERPCRRQMPRQATECSTFLTVQAPCPCLGMPDMRRCSPPCSRWQPPCRVPNPLC